MPFNTSLYSITLPKNVEEGLQDPKRKKAMEEETSASRKMKYGRNVTYQKVKRP